VTRVWPWPSRKKSAADIVELWLFARHKKGYCLRPEKCMCDEARAALQELRELEEAHREEG